MESNSHPILKPQTQKSLVRLAAGLLFVFFFMWLLNALSSITTLLMTTLVLAYILNPVVNKLTAWGLSRSLASALIIMAGGLLFIGLLVFFIPAVLREITSFLKLAPAYLIRLQEVVLNLANRFEVQIPSDWDAIWAFLSDRWRQVLPKMADPAARIVSTLFASTLHVISAIFYLLLIPVITYYLMVSFESIKITIHDLIPPYLRPAIIEKLRTIDSMMASFVRGQLTICIILSALYTAGFLLIGLDLAVFLGTLSGMLFIIPYVGTGIGILSGSIMALAKYGDFIHVAYVFLWIGGVQLLESYVFTPKIVGEAIGLNPVVYILALIVGGNLFGFVGMLIAIPVTAILKVLLNTMIEIYKKTYLYDDSVNPKIG